MKNASTLRSYVTAALGPWIISINRILNDASGFIQSNVTASATNAATASTAATNAAASQAAALTSQTAAQSSATNAAGSATSASQSVTTVNAIIVALNKVYLGAKTADPTVDNNGQALVDGAMYLNTADNPEQLRIYENGAWVNSDAAVDAAMSAAQVSAAQAAASAASANTYQNEADTYAQQAAASAAAAEAAAGSASGYLPTLSPGTADYYIRVNTADTGYELRSPVQTLTDLSAAPLASPTFTGTPISPTVAKDTATDQIATGNFVLNQASAVTPLINAGTGSIGTSFRYARADHVHPSDTSRAAAGGSINQAFSASLFLAGWGKPLGNGVPPLGGYSFANDGVNDTGMFSDADGVLYFYNNAVLTITLDASNIMTVNSTANFLGNLNAKGPLNLQATNSTVTLTTAPNSNGLTIANPKNTMMTVDLNGNLGVAADVNAYGFVASNSATINGPVNLSGTTTSVASGSRIYYDSIDNLVTIQSGTFYFNFRPDASFVAQGSISSGGALIGQGLTLPADSVSVVGNLELYGATPHINYYYGSASVPDVQMINSASGELSIINSATGNLQAQFGSSYWTLGYATTTTAGVRLVGQNDGNLVVYKDTKATSGTTSSAVFNISPANGMGVNCPALFTQATTFSTTTFNGVGTFNYDMYVGASLRLNSSSAKMTFGSNSFNWLGSDGSAALSLNATPGGQSLTSTGPIVAPSLYFQNGTATSVIYKDANLGDLVFQLNDGSNNHDVTFGNTGVVTASAFSATGDIVSNGIILANEGLPGKGGYSFIQDGGYDTGMFSDADGVLYLYANGQAYITMNSSAGYVAMGKNLAISGTLTTSGEASLGGLVVTGAAANFEQGAILPAPPAGDNSASVPNTNWVVSLQQDLTMVNTIVGKQSTPTTQAATTSFTITVPPGRSKFFYEGIAAGGGGSSCSATSTSGDVSGGGGGSGAYSLGYFAVTAGATYTVTLGPSGSTQVPGGECQIIDQNNNIILTLFGGQGASFTQAAGSFGAQGGYINAANGVVQIKAQNGCYGSDGQSGPNFIFTGNGAASYFGGGGRAGSEAGISATVSGAGGGGAYDSLLSGKTYQGGAGGPAQFSWWFGV